MLVASCHCGAVNIELAQRPNSLTQCTCSICRRYGALWAYGTRQTMHVRAAPEAVAAYLWNDKVIQFYHCKTCGCLTHYESTEKRDDSRVAVNARMLLPAEIAGITVRTFDGAGTWKYLE
jgi:hypothetical protein